MAQHTGTLNAKADGDGAVVKVHPLFVRITHWINAIAIIIMIGSGWHIYNNHPIFEWLTFPRWAVLGGDPALTYKLNKDVGFGNALLWHFAAMWVFFINGTAALIYGFATGRLQQRWFPIRISNVWHDFLEAFAFLKLLIPFAIVGLLILGMILGYWMAFIGFALALLFAALLIDFRSVKPRDVFQAGKAEYQTFLKAHDVRMYNAVQKVSYAGVILAALLTFFSGLAIWKPVQLSWLTWMFYDFQGARLAHFLGMVGIVVFMVLHVSLALLVPKTIVGMTKGSVRIGAPEEMPSLKAGE